MDYVTRTVKIPLNLDQAAVRPLLLECTEIYNIYTQWAIDNKTWSKLKAHKELYEKLRKQFPNIPSALIQSIRDNALESIKQNKFKCASRKKTLSARYDLRTSTLRGSQLTFSTNGKRHKEIINIPKYFIDKYPDRKFVGGTLKIDKKNQVLFCLAYKIPKREIVDGTVVGLDRGVNNLITTSDGRSYSGNTVKKQQRKYLYNRKTLQAKGTRSAKRRLAAISGREKRFNLNINHQITKSLVNSSHAVFVLEDLSKIGAKRRGKVLNKRLHSWPFKQLEHLLKYKAEDIGKSVVFVDARYTSQKCSMCGHTYKGNRKKSVFKCVVCNYTDHADINAAINIRDQYISNNLAAKGGTGCSQSPDDAPSLDVVASLQPCVIGN